MLSPEKVATPLTAAWVIVPVSVPLLGLVPIATVMFPVNPLAVLPLASWSVAQTAGVIYVYALALRRALPIFERRARRAPGARRREGVARPRLVDAQPGEGRDPRDGRHGLGAGQGPAARVRPDRHRDVPREPAGRIAARI